MHCPLFSLQGGKTMDVLWQVQDDTSPQQKSWQVSSTLRIDYWSSSSPYLLIEKNNIFPPGKPLWKQPMVEAWRRSRSSRPHWSTSKSMLFRSSEMSLVERWEKWIGHEHDIMSYSQMSQMQKPWKNELFLPPCGCSSFIILDQVVAGEVRWVITVPAIWRQQAKQFMREAAYQV